MNIREDLLLTEIRAAFAENQYPGDDQLTVYDRAGRNYDRTHQLLVGKSWENFPIAEFLSGDTPIPDLTAYAFHYFLPGLLIASLGKDVEVSADLVNILTFYFSPSNVRSAGEFGYDDSERFNLRIKLLTHRQRSVVVRVLEEFVMRGWMDQEEVQEAIDCLRTQANGKDDADSVRR